MARILVVLATLFAVLSLLAGFVRWQVLDTGTVKETAELLIADQEVRNETAISLVDELYANVDVAAALGERLPQDQRALAPVLAGASRELAERAAERLLERPRVATLWVRSIETTHEQLLRLLDDDLTTVQTEGGFLVLNLRPLVIQLGDRVAVVGRVAEQLPQSSGRIRLMEATELEAAQDATQLLKTLGAFLFVVPLLLAALALWLAVGRRRAILRSLALGLVLAGVLVLVIRGIAGSYVVDSLVTAESARPAAENAWEILTRLLADGGWFLMSLGAVGLLGVWITGATGAAFGARRALAPSLARPEYAFGVAAALLLLLVWWAPLVQFRRGLLVLAMGVVLAIGVEALRRLTAREFPARGSA